jgi:hypothetical protein
MKQHKIILKVDYLGRDKQYFAKVSVNSGIIFDGKGDKLLYEADEFMNQNCTKIDLVDFLDAFVVNTWEVLNVDVIESDEILKREIIEDDIAGKQIAKEAEITKIKNDKKELKLLDKQLGNFPLAINNEIKPLKVLKNNTDIEIKYAKQKFIFPVATLYSWFSLKGLINTGKLGDDLRLDIGDDEHKIFKIYGRGHYSLVASNINIYDQSELGHTRTPSMFDMPVAGIIIRTPTESDDRRRIIITDRSRQFQCDIDVESFINKCIELKCIKPDGTIDIVKLLTTTNLQTQIEENSKILLE